MRFILERKKQKKGKKIKDWMNKQVKESGKKITDIYYIYKSENVWVILEIMG